MRVSHDSQDASRRNAAERATRAFDSHTILDEGSNGRVRSFLCRRRASETCWFRIVFSPFHIWVSGDIGTMTLLVSEGDALAWLRKYAAATAYLWTKVQGREDHQSFYVEDAKAFLNELDSHEEERNRRAAEQVREQWDPLAAEHDAVGDWLRVCREAGIEEPPTCVGPSWGALFIFEALAWFVREIGNLQNSPAGKSEIQKPCSCGGEGCEGAHDSLRHHCGGPREACGAPGCPECRAPSPDTAQLRARVAELEAAIKAAVDTASAFRHGCGRCIDHSVVFAQLRGAIHGTTALDTAISAAVRAEREACAEVLRKRRNKHHRAAFNAELQVEQDEAELREIEAHECMEAIRARGES